MKNVKTIGIIGAGLSGLVTAKTCLEYGFDIIVYEKDAELGGVWATSRRYPGITTQNTKDTYAFSDFPMPDYYPEWPSGEQVQSYLIDYAKHFNLLSSIRFSHEIIEVSRDEHKWKIVGNNKDSQFIRHFDFLIICNGTFSTPKIPQIPGMDGFIQAGGETFHSTQFNSISVSSGKHLVVVGYGKSATDIIAIASETSKSAHLVYREPKWKIPRYIMGINMKYLLLNRLGEAVIKPESQYNWGDRFVNKIGLGKAMLRFLERYITKKHMLKELNLVPSSSLKDQAFGEIALETPNFYEKVNQNLIVTMQGEIIGLNGKKAVLSNGSIIECDVLVFSVGFNQTIPFLPKEYLQKFTDNLGNYILYHHILPAGVPDLAFVGYNSSIQCPISSEFAALWICEYLKGRIAKPTDMQIFQEGIDFINWRSQFRPNGASRGLSTMPGTIHHVDILLKDMNASLPVFSLIPDWLLTINPSRYFKVRRMIVNRNNQKQTNINEL